MWVSLGRVHVRIVTSTPLEDFDLETVMSCLDQSSQVIVDSALMNTRDFTVGKSDGRVLMTMTISVKKLYSRCE